MRQYNKSTIIIPDRSISGHAKAYYNAAITPTLSRYYRRRWDGEIGTREALLAGCVARPWSNAAIWLLAAYDLARGTLLFPPIDAWDYAVAEIRRRRATSPLDTPQDDL